MTNDVTGTGAPAAADATVVTSDEQADADVDADRWCTLAAAVLAAEAQVGELTLTFVDRDEIAALNAEHLGREGPTDVLSFPLDASVAIAAAVSDQPRLLGDVVICPAVAAANVATHTGSYDDEVALLVVHGILHVLGHDHADADDSRRMRRRELELLEAHHWHGPAPAGFRQEQSP